MNKGKDQVLIRLSREKWQWMADCQIDKLGELFHDEAVFVHMGATMTKAEELEVIRTGRIHYKKVDIQQESVRFIGDTAIVLCKHWMTAVVGGNEVVNPFVATEVYVLDCSRWRLASLSFTRLLGE